MTRRCDTRHSSEIPRSCRTWSWNRSFSMFLTCGGSPMFTNILYIVNAIIVSIYRTFIRENRTPIGSPFRQSRYDNDRRSAANFPRIFCDELDVDERDTRKRRRVAISAEISLVADHRGRDNHRIVSADNRPPQLYLPRDANTNAIYLSLDEDTKLLRAPTGSLVLEMLISGNEEEYHEGWHIWRGERARIPAACRRPGSRNIKGIDNYTLNWAVACHYAVVNATRRHQDWIPEIDGKTRVSPRRCPGKPASNYVETH